MSVVLTAAKAHFRRGVDQADHHVKVGPMGGSQSLAWNYAVSVFCSCWLPCRSQQFIEVVVNTGRSEVRLFVEWGAAVPHIGLVLVDDDE